MPHHRMDILLKGVPMFSRLTEHICTNSYLSELQYRVNGSFSSVALALDRHFIGDSRSCVHY